MDTAALVANLDLIIREGQGKYVPLCSHAGVLINDPILLKLDVDRYWFSIADSNIWFWARAIAAERGLDVEVSEPDVSPSAVISIPGHQPPARIADGSAADALKPWPERHVLGTRRGRLGPNRDGRQW